MAIILVGAVLLALVSAAHMPTLSHRLASNPKREQSAPLNRMQMSEHEPFRFLDVEPERSSFRERRAVITPPLGLYQSYPPNELEIAVVGPVTNPIYPSTPAFFVLLSNVCSFHFLRSVSLIILLRTTLASTSVLLSPAFRTRSSPRTV